MNIFPLCYLAVDFRTPSNVGALFRLADALGIEKIYLTGTSITPPNPKLKRLSRSTEQSVPFAYWESPIAMAAELREQGYRLICLEVGTDSIELDALEISPSEKACLILGSEREGVATELLEMADEVVHIPMRGINASMNVVTACAIASYAITRQQKDA
ncbi:MULTISPECIES: TrmH family RNA methyltransferase [Microbulbifer]|uniref:TrmH family RNA methyltransferase n=1 Tax=Microbulbifer TaxID=48073 RepID=UPI00074A0F27|nr:MULTISPECIES: TrmH family RNA methyltransferase [Microbulbifer]KUJ84195.1 hypothetical protein AVO43_00310 [Microbulbifer sp. ZGT114]